MVFGVPIFAQSYEPPEPIDVTGLESASPEEPVEADGDKNYYLGRDNHFSAWLTEFHIFECHTSVAEMDTELLEPHTGLAFTILQRYSFNHDKRQAYTQTLKEGVWKGPGEELFNNVWGIFFGVELVSREIEFNVGGFKDIETNQHLVLPFGVSYQFAYSENWVQAIDLGGFYDIGLDEYNSRITLQELKVQPFFGVYFAAPVYYFLNPYVAIGAKIGVKYALGDMFEEVEESSIVDAYFGIQARFLY